MSASLNLNIFKGKLAYHYEIHPDGWFLFNLILFLKALLNFYAEALLLFLELNFRFLYFGHFPSLLERQL